MKWAYRTLDTSQTHFHYPGKKADSENFQLSQNLENAENWLHGRAFPSWGALHTNLLESFEAMSKCDDPAYQRSVEPEVQNSIVLIVFIARVATFIARGIDEHYGTATLQKLITQYKEQDAALRDDVHADMHKVITTLISTVGNQSQEVIDCIWRDYVPRYWAERVSPAFIQAGEEAQNFLMRNQGDPLTQDQMSYLERRYGPYLSACLKQMLEAQQEYRMPMEFAELIADGERLRRNARGRAEIIAYKSSVSSSNWQGALSWLAEWCEGSYYRRQGDLRNAHKHLGKAFNAGKYCAGERQRDLLHEYMDVCAKLSKWQDFKKAVAWARYLQIPIRWLSDEAEETEEELRSLFKLYKDVAWTM